MPKKFSDAPMTDFIALVASIGEKTFGKRIVLFDCDTGEIIRYKRLADIEIGDLTCLYVGPRYNDSPFVCIFISKKAT